VSRFDNHVKVSQSVLDRLIDLDPKESREVPKSQAASLADMKQAVRRDLEWLLNTRCYTQALDDGLTEAEQSVAFYGLPDFTSLSVGNDDERYRVKSAIERAIKYFEPRFSDVTVSVEPISSVDRSLKLRIEATLEVEPTPEAVAFDTVLELGSGNFAVSGG
jgi:type VI secretion system protein ImpF